MVSGKRAAFLTNACMEEKLVRRRIPKEEEDTMWVRTSRRQAERARMSVMNHINAPRGKVMSKTVPVSVPTTSSGHNRSTCITTVHANSQRPRSSHNISPTHADVRMVYSKRQDETTPSNAHHSTTLACTERPDAFVSSGG